jgi:hypothetical protein
MKVDYVTIVSILLPFVVGWLLRSPIGKYIPSPVADVLAELSPQAIEEMYEHLSTKQARRESAIEYVQIVSARYGVQVDADTATALVDYLTKAYKRVAR